MERIRSRVKLARTRARMRRHGIGRSCCGNGEIGHCSCRPGCQCGCQSCSC